jgi:hypothetical protein
MRRISGRDRHAPAVTNSDESSIVRVLIMLPFWRVASFGRVSRRFLGAADAYQHNAGFVSILPPRGFALSIVGRLANPSHTEFAPAVRLNGHGEKRPQSGSLLCHRTVTGGVRPDLDHGLADRKLGAHRSVAIFETREASGDHGGGTFAPLAVLSPGLRLAGTPGKGRKRWLSVGTAH